MAPKHLTIYDKPEMQDTRLVLGLSGWMDGGDVSTATVDLLAEQLEMIEIAEIDPEPFTIYSVPGSMEVSAVIRPHGVIEDGRVAAYERPHNVFHASPAHRLIVFHGREPNLRWRAFSDCMFEVVRTFDVRMVYFVGSYGGTVPHTRDPRLYSACSTPGLCRKMREKGFRLSSYEGPSGLVTHLLKAAEERKIPLASIVAEIPSYLQGRHPGCILHVIRRLAALLDIPVDLDELAGETREFEEEIRKLLESKDELKDMVSKLEAQYDSDHLETEMGDLKEWLQEQGFKVD